MKFLGYVVASLIGFVIGHYLLHGAAAAFTSILVSYHLYLFFLVLGARHEKGISLPIGQTIFTHLAFLVVVIGIPYLRAQIPLFGLIALLVPGLAPFETKWLFSGQGSKSITVDESRPVEPAFATAVDHEEFRLYLRSGNRRFRKPGATVDEEFKAWLADRAKKRATAPRLGGSVLPYSDTAKVGESQGGNGLI